MNQPLANFNFHFNSLDKADIKSHNINFLFILYGLIYITKLFRQFSKHFLPIRYNATLCYAVNMTENTENMEVKFVDKHKVANAHKVNDSNEDTCSCFKKQTLYSHNFD